MSDRSPHGLAVLHAADPTRNPYSGEMFPHDSRWAYLLDIRRTRSDKRGQAAGDDQRGALYGAALRQFEELLASAQAAGYAGRSIPLFYALSQAGRAIVAAYGEHPTVDGHGL